HARESRAVPPDRVMGRARAGGDADYAAAGRSQPAGPPAGQRRARALYADRYHRGHPGQRPPGTLGQSRVLQSGGPEVLGGPLVSRGSHLALVVVLLAAAPAAAQSRSAQRLVSSQELIGRQQLDSADIELAGALETAPYIMDSCWAYVWRGVLEYERGHYRLARLSFRRAFALYPD